MNSRAVKRPLKIAMLVNDFPRISQTFVLSQITDLIDRGHDVSIFSRNATFENKLHPDIHSYKLFQLWNIIPMRQGKFNTLRKKWGSWLAARLLTYISRSKTCCYLWCFQRRYGDALAIWKPWHTRYDVIHAHFGPAGHWGLFLKDIGVLEGPLTVSIRGYDLPKEQTATVDKILWDRAEVVQPSSKSLAESLASFGCPPEKCQIIYSGIVLDRFPQREAAPLLEGEIRILSVGRLVEKKGFSHALEAFALVLAKNPHARYTIVGDGPLRLELEEKSRKLGLAERVVFHGSGSRREILEFLRQAHVFWAVSVTASNGDVEGDLNTVKEALAVGVPTVATRHGGIPEMIDHGVTGLLVPERDASALYDATQNLLAHPETWPSLATHGRQKVEDLFEHNRLSDELEAIYYRMAASPPTSPRIP